MKKAQSILEFAILIVAIVAALLAMQVYLRRGLQGRLRSGADEISAQQYEPGNMNSDVTVTQVSNISTKTETEEIANATKYETTTTTTINSQIETRNGTENILPEQ